MFAEVEFKRFFFFTVFKSYGVTLVHLIDCSLECSCMFMYVIFFQYILPLCSWTRHFFGLDVLRSSMCIGLQVGE